ncbi:MAG: T9SS type A sorting domain-containing protein [Flavobacteriia bacterium]|nr:T9SS type A sorting domain-containing protein [Flavobacteriia bacterium]
MSCTQFMDAQVITTLAGGSGYGFADGSGSSAKFNFPAGITTDLQGNVYVADTENHKIRRITPTGVVTTFAGSIPWNPADGVVPDGWGTDARFRNPRSICKDADGNMYVSDYDTNIRKVTLSQDVTTVSYVNGGSIKAICLYAGNFYLTKSVGIRVVSFGGNFDYILAGGEFSGNVDGTGTAAKFSNPTDICHDGSGNFYVTDNANHNIRKVTTGGVVTTFAGSTIGNVDAIGTSAKFSAPEGICIDQSGNLYVADYGNAKIRKITPNGIVTTIATLTGSYRPKSICIDTVGNLYATCINNIDHKIIKITLTLDINDSALINNLKIYPNPAKDHITIDCGALVNVEGYSIKIINTLGQELFNQPLNTTQYTIPLNASIGQGIYFVNVIDGQGNTIDVKKIILQSLLSDKSK